MLYEKPNQVVPIKLKTNGMISNTSIPMSTNTLATIINPPPDSIPEATVLAASTVPSGLVKSGALVLIVYGGFSRFQCSSIVMVKLLFVRKDCIVLCLELLPL